MHARKSLDCHEETIGRNVDIRGDSGEILKRKEEHVIGNWKKGDLCYKGAKNLAKLCSSILWKVEIVSD